MATLLGCSDPDAAAGGPSLPVPVGAGQLSRREHPMTVGVAAHQAAGLDGALLSCAERNAALRP